MPTHFDPLQLGDVLIQNRIWTSVSSSGQAQCSNDQVASTVEAFRQRASAGLILVDPYDPMMNIHRHGRSAPSRSGIRRLAGWRKITDAVHDEGGTIFCQLSLPNHANPVEEVHRKVGRVRSTSTLIDDYVFAASHGIASGFDGIEIDATLGRTPSPFFSPTSSRYLNHFDMTMERWARFLLELFEAISVKVPKHRIGVRLSPLALAGPSDPNPHDFYSFLANKLDSAGAGFLHFTDPSGMSGVHEVAEILSMFRPAFSRPLVANCKLPVAKGADLLATGKIQAQVFEDFDSDLVAKIALGIDLGLKQFSQAKVSPPWRPSSP